MRKSIIATGAVLVLLSTAACGASTADRSSGAGKAPDSSQDAWNVKVFNNADNVPNTVIFCINREDPMAILSTLSGGDSGKDKAAQILRLPEFDVSYCGGRAK